MKRSLLAGVAAAAIMIYAIEVALPADLAPVYKAPAPIVAPDLWTGFYFGVHAGGAWGTKEYNFVGDPFVLSNGVNGFLGGVQGGYNRKIGWVVIGVEGEFSWADVKGTGSVFHAHVDWTGSVAGRIGGTVDRALLYVKGGAVWVHDKYSENGLGSGDVICAGPCPVAVFTSSYTKVGALFGVGAEYAFPDKWSGKIEYNYMDFGKRVALFCNPSFCEDVEIRQNVHVIKAGLNRRF